MKANIQIPDIFIDKLIPELIDLHNEENKEVTDERYISKNDADRGTHEEVSLS